MGSSPYQRPRAPIAASATALSRLSRWGVVACAGGLLAYFASQHLVDAIATSLLVLVVVRVDRRHALFATRREEVMAKRERKLARRKAALAASASASAR